MQLCFGCSQTVSVVGEKKGSLEVFNRMFSHQAEWREEVKRHFEKIKSEGTCLHRLDEELINRRREELRSRLLLLFNRNFLRKSSRYATLLYICYISVHHCGV